MTREHNVLNDIAELKNKILKLKLLNNVYIYSQMYHKCLISLFSITYICFLKNTKVSSVKTHLFPEKTQF